MWSLLVSRRPPSSTIFDPTTPPPPIPGSPSSIENDAWLEASFEVQKSLVAEDSADSRYGSWLSDDAKQFEDIEKYERTMDEIVEDFLRSPHSPAKASASLVGNYTIDETVEKESEDLSRLQEENDALRRELSEKDRIVEALQEKLKLQSTGDC